MACLEKQDTGFSLDGAQMQDVMGYLLGISSPGPLLVIHEQINGAIKRNLEYVSGSFKVLRRTWKVLSIQAVFHFFIQLMAVTLEEKGEDTGSEQLVMLMVLTRVSFPGQEPKILE